jgi:integrase
VALRTISETLGHPSLRMTEEVYLHVFDGMRRAAADSMDGVLAV